MIQMPIDRSDEELAPGYLSSGRHSEQNPISAHTTRSESADHLMDHNADQSAEHKKCWSGQTSQGVSWAVHLGDANTVLADLPRNSYQCVVTSPPYYWLRDYGVNGQMGLEETVTQYVESLANTMDRVKDVLSPTGVLFLNLGDTYYSGKGVSRGIDKKSSKRRFGVRAVDKSGGLGISLRPKTVIGVPWRVAIEMIQKGWVLRSSIIWHRKHSLPESVSDRPRRSYEYIFMFVKSQKYFFDRQALLDAEEEDMWTIAARPEANGSIDTAPFPDDLVRRCLDIGCSPSGAVLDPFAGSGTTLRVAVQSGRPATGIDLNPDFCRYMLKRLNRI